MTDFMYANKGGGGIFRKGQLGPIGQGTVGIDLVIDIFDLAQAPIDLTGYTTITGRMKKQDTGAVTAIDGTRTLVGTGSTGKFTWVVSANDSGTDGLFDVVFNLSNGTDTIVTLPGELLITNNPSVTASANNLLIGILQATSDWLDDEKTAIEAAADGEILQSDGTNSEGSGITAVELNAVLGTGGTDNFVWTADAVGGAGWEAAAGGVADIDDLTDVTIDGTPADNELLAYNTGTSQWINQTAAEAGLSATGHVHAAGDVTSGTFADALISQSNVTQHQAALSISSGQVTGLGTLATQSGTFSGGGTFASAGFTLTLSGNGGTLALGGFTLTVPATGTAALLETANVFTQQTTFSAGAFDTPAIKSPIDSTGFYFAASEIKVTIGAVARTTFGPTSINIVNTGGAFSIGSSADVAFGRNSSGGTPYILKNSANTNTAVPFTLRHNSSGTPAAGFGSDLVLQLESSTTADQIAGQISALWNVATHASAVSDLVGYAAYNSGAGLVASEVWRGRGGASPLIGFLGATPVARAAHIADPTGGGTVDAECRTATNAILVILENLGFKATS